MWKGWLVFVVFMFPLRASSSSYVSSGGSTRCIPAFGKVRACSQFTVLHMVIHKCERARNVHMHLSCVSRARPFSSPSPREGAARWGAGRSHEGSVTWGRGGGLGALMSRSHDDSPDPAEEKKEKKKRVRVIARTSWEKGMDSGTTRCGHCGCVFLRENICSIWCTCGVELCSIDCARRHRCAGPMLTMEVTDDEEEVEEEEEKQEEEEDAGEGRGKIRRGLWPPACRALVLSF